MINSLCLLNKLPSPYINHEHIGKSGAMRPCGTKRTSTCSHKIKNGKKKAFIYQQLQLTTKRFVTKNEQPFLDFEIIITVVFFAFLI